VLFAAKTGFAPKKEFYTSKRKIKNDKQYLLPKENTKSRQSMKNIENVRKQKKSP